LGAFTSRLHDLQIQILPRFGNTPLVFDTVAYRTPNGQRISVTRLDFLMSEFALRQAGGTWVSMTNSFVYISAREGHTSSRLSGVPSARYDKIRFTSDWSPK